MHIGLQKLGIPVTYFELPEDSIAEDESQEATRYAELLEVTHTACHIAQFEWKKYWQPVKGHRNPLKGHTMNSMFFDPFLLIAENGEAAKR
jgi:hypothetical protein